MIDLTIAPSAVQAFINRWKASGASERANYQLFLTELCALLGVEHPRPSSDRNAENTYCFERPVIFDDGEGKTSTGFIDLYKKDCFVLEAKQGSDRPTESEDEILGGASLKRKAGTARRETREWDRSMKRAKEQALRYARSLPTSEGWPPFLLVVDVGYCFDLYADFARQGKTYVPFPDPQGYRFGLEDLHNPQIRERLKGVFSEPLSLDPSRRAARVTRQLAERLAKLASSLESTGHLPEAVAQFLMRCLFTMFAEDAKLLPADSFKGMLHSYRENLDVLPDALEALWQTMDRGGFDPALRVKITQFNGGLFKGAKALPVTAAQLDLLIESAEADWKDVEPAIFGTLLERALEPQERHKLGAHFTPRAYVERLVLPTVIEPLREEWNAAQTASKAREDQNDVNGARQEIETYHRRLCSIKILDPACGSGNFLYVTLEHLKRLEAEVLEVLAHFPGQLGLDMTGSYSVSPAQFLGLEINPRAAAIADVVLWIGYLQWHLKTYGDAKRLNAPILKDYGNIQCRDAVLEYRERVPRLDREGNAVTRWDGITTKSHPVTGQEVPDETARTAVYDYLDPKPAQWPDADFINGNPPYIGAKYFRESLGDGYTEALRRTYKDGVPESSDLVMYWWHKAAEKVGIKKVERFGFITTNSIKQAFNQRVIQSHLLTEAPVSIIYCIPDHPWTDSADGAAVEVSMTVAIQGVVDGRLGRVIEETETGGDAKDVILQEKRGRINADLTVGANVADSKCLKANELISCPGVKLHGAGFIVTAQEAGKLGYGISEETRRIIRPYRNGRDLTSRPREVFVIDLYGVQIDETRRKFPEV